LFEPGDFSILPVEQKHVDFSVDVLCPKNSFQFAVEAVNQTSVVRRHRSEQGKFAAALRQERRGKL
jgi:hypothetical protein